MPNLSDCDRVETVIRFLCGLPEERACAAQAFQTNVNNLKFKGRDAERTAPVFLQRRGIAGLWVNAVALKLSNVPVAK